MNAYEGHSQVDAGEPSAVDPETAKEMGRIHADRLDELGTSLPNRRDEWMQSRPVVAGAPAFRTSCRCARNSGAMNWLNLAICFLGELHHKRQRK